MCLHLELLECCLQVCMAGHPTSMRPMHIEAGVQHFQLVTADQQSHSNPQRLGCDEGGGEGLLESLQTTPTVSLMILGQTYVATDGISRDWDGSVAEPIDIQKFGL